MKLSFLQQNDYNLSILADDEKCFKPFDLNDESVIGVNKNESFKIKLWNNSRQRVQARISVDGTDILTGNPASLSPNGQMWMIEPNGTLLLSAWPETMNGGSKFVFTSEDKSVAANTHGVMTGVGLISAAMYVEGQPVRFFGYNYTHNNNYGYNKNILRSNGPRGQGCNSNDDFILCASSVDLSSLAVGAGEYTPQTITTTGGLVKPVLDHILQIRYEPWAKLQKRVQVKGTDAFPGTPKEKLIDLRKVPKVRSKSKAPSVERFL